MRCRSPDFFFFFCSPSNFLYIAYVNFVFASFSYHLLKCMMQYVVSTDKGYNIYVIFPLLWTGAVTLSSKRMHTGSLYHNAVYGLSLA